MLLHDARRDARVAPDGGFRALDEQDRSRWDRLRLGEGLEALDRAMRFRRPGQYQLQAAPLLADPALERYQPLHAVHADLLRRAGDPAAAARAYERAIALSANAIERAELHRRLEALDVD
jgi:RNA polymerase sigma-70 factor, ECF subfamily